VTHHYIGVAHSYRHGKNEPVIKIKTLWELFEEEENASDTTE
jgi:hypothetical protein